MMSKLYSSEDGRIIPTLCEELTTFRRARKVLWLPPTSAPGTLYVLARPYENGVLPLHLSVNGTEVPGIQVVAGGSYRWYDVSIAASALRSGDNVLELWADSTAMDAWSLALEAGHASPGSFVSDDGGRTWRNDRMGYLSAVRGEYAVRMRLEEENDPAPPAMVWEDPDHPRVQSLRKILPPEAREQGPTLKRVRALSSWLASSWEHTNSNRATQYAPWDAETILAWGPARLGHNGKRPIVMCVHYAVAVVSGCQAVGIPARCAVVTGALDGPDGHFVAEVWFEDHGKWVVVDPNTDAIFWKDGVPLSMTEIREAGPALGEMIEWGAGTEFQRTFGHIDEFIESTLGKGVCFRHRSIWPRADLLSHPEYSPPGHGSLAYCETMLVWEKHDLESGFGMFPYFGDAGYFDAPPFIEG